MNPQDMRLDSGESIFFARELESIDQRIYMIEYPLLKGRQLLPKVTDVGEWDQLYTYTQYQTFGRAKIIANGARDIPRADVTGVQVTTPVKPLALGYGYDLMDIRTAAAKGKPLDDFKARATRQGMEEEVDELLAFGSTLHGIKGFVNDTEVDATYTPAHGTWVASSRTGLEVVEDVNKLVNQSWAALKEAEALNGKFTVAMSSDEYAYAATTMVGANANMSALEVLLKSPFIEDIVPWFKLDGAGDSGKNRAICFRKDPMILGAIVPMEYNPQPIQQMGLRFERDALMSCGGACIRYKVAVRYGDGW